MIDTKILPRLGSLFSILLFIFCVWVLARELRGFEFREVLDYLASLPKYRVYLAIGLTALSYWVMTWYDVLALLYIRHQLPYRKIAFTAFIAYAISNTVGFTIFIGGAIRYRLYKKWGLSPFDIAQVTAFVSLTFWLGLLALGGLVFPQKPVEISHMLGLHFLSIHSLGIIFITIIISYFIATIIGKGNFQLFNREFRFPSWKYSIAQITTATADWVLAGGVFYCLLPPQSHLSYQEFFGIYLMAHFAGILSNVPAGIGVFETIILLLLSSSFSKVTILGSILAYRGIYYLSTLLIGVILLGLYEMRHRLFS
ncbi:lysylphosphatidylglycerol synthase domain-containing protein [[Phormidium] sp. ETS-05]|uniref:lysylphosphatidylglycerol synthase domain-containing protein n=1 Tax=[Phormidium] sp. ETS-05 TaxID=222819 RepID=UPI0018EF28A2|nr:lysylphosphatidylglycerol synthase domain-containing protein [[Phormidium] sp. ETS-05]